jgi:DNA helicase-2/ATP-dependent DNA helicase PcrA
MTNELSVKQTQIVESDEKYIVVLAGAGSGKTRVMTEKIVRSSRNLRNGEKILAITFSNKATEELRDRLNISLGVESVSEKTYVGTIHSLCSTIITSFGYLIGLPDNLQICDKYEDRFKIFVDALKNVTNLDNKIRNIFDDKKRKQTINELIEYISDQKRSLHFASDYESGTDRRALFIEYDDALLHQSLIDFDDIIRYAYKILLDNPNATKIYRRIYREIFIDEAQDLNYSQYQIIKLLAGDDNKIVMVGDPNQAIYGFNGASTSFITEIFPNEYKAVKFEMNENFRSTRSVINAASKIEKDFITEGVYALEGDFNVYSFTDELAESKWVVSRILELQKQGHQDLQNQYLKLENCAVIARNRYVFNTLRNQLENSKIAYNMKVSPRGSFSSESDLMRVFELGIRLYANDKDTIHLKELQEIVKDNHFNSIHEFVASKGLTNEWQIIVSHLDKAWTRLNTNNDHDVNVKLALDEICQYVNRTDHKPSDDERFLIEEDLKLWESNWKTYVQNSSSGERTFYNFVRSVSLITNSPLITNGVTLSTVHMSKGLEYDVVFVIGANEGVFPDYRASSDSSGKEMEEEKHSFFVAITRAKRLCYVTFPNQRMMPWGGLKIQQVSRFLRDFHVEKSPDKLSKS